MCRWFAYISATEPCLLEDVLITPKHALIKQVNEHFLPGLTAQDPNNYYEDPLIRARNSYVNIDGTGVAWYTSSAADFEPTVVSIESSGVENKEGLRPAAYKTIVPPIRDINFRSICANTETRVLFAHIRAASGAPIVHVNNHPFIFGIHTGMHNGYITDFSVIRRAMLNKMSDAAHAAILGGTDSEHIFALYMTYLTKNGDASTWDRIYPIEAMVSALHDAVATIINLQIEMLGSKMTPNSLNLCVTDGTKLVAYRFRNHANQEPPSLYYSTTAGTTLNRKYQDHPDGIEVMGDAERKPREDHGKHLIVASEPSTYREEDWTLIGRNQALLTDSHGKFRIVDIPCDKKWEAEDPTFPSRR